MHIDWNIKFHFGQVKAVFLQMAKNQFTPLQSGKLCPFNSTEWETMKRKWNCPDPEFYHCIPDQYNVPGEICVKANWASKNYCPIFNTAANDIDLIPCDLQYGACSDTDYRSNNVYQYPGCLNKTSFTKITSSSTEGSPSPVLLPVLIPVIVVAVLFLAIGIICLIKRNKRKGTSKSIESQEMQHLLDTKAIPIEFRRPINYLNADVFVPTEMYRRAVGILETQGWITLIGPAGCGKTMTAIQLAKRKLGCTKSATGRKCTFQFCQSLNDIPELSNEKTEPYIILDDFMEQYRYYPSKLSEDKGAFDDIFQKFISRGLGHVIFTIKEDTWRSLSKNDLHPEVFKSNTLLNLTEKLLTAKEKESMLRNHLRINHIAVTVNKKEENLTRGKEVSLEMNIIQNSVTNLNGYSTVTIHKDTIQKIAEKLTDDCTFVVPIIIDLLSVNSYLMRSHQYILSDTFRKTLKIHITKWIKSGEDEDKKSVCMVLFVGLCGGVASIEDFHSKTKGQIYANVCKRYEVKPSDQLEIENMMKENARVRGFLYSALDTSNTYAFHHDSLLDFFLVYACIDDKFFIENADIDYILRRCKLPGLAGEKIKQIFAIGRNQDNVELKAIDKLVHRIRTEIEQGHRIPDWERHVFRKHETFNEKWNSVSSTGTSKCDMSNKRGEDARVEESGDKK